MPSFTYSSRMREGQWRGFRKFMLEERRDSDARVKVIQAELDRIGDLRIMYEVDNEGKVTERRLGIVVGDADSSLAKLMQAYTSLGGNPFDISMFISPDSGVRIGEVEQATAPGGGVVHPQDIKYSFDSGGTDGDANLLKYKPSRMGGAVYAPQEAKILVIMQRGRKWISQECWHKRTRLEELIIKMCDLREQLETEVEEIVWAMAGDTVGSPGYGSEGRFNDSLTAGNIAYFFDSTFRVPGGFADDASQTVGVQDPAQAGRVTVDNTALAGQPGSVNMGVLGGYPSLMSDEDEEDNTSF